MSTVETLSTRLRDLEAAPPAFRAALFPMMDGTTPQSLIFSPPTTFGHRRPATLLAVTPDRWAVASDDADGTVTARGSPFSRTLLVQMAEVLLFGLLRVDYATDAAAGSAVVYFDTVQRRFYHEAVDQILAGVEATGTTPPAPLEAEAVNLHEWPPNFQVGIRRSLADGQRVVSATHWPAIGSGFGRELAPAAGLLLTDRDILLVSDENAVPGVPKCGVIATHFPLARLARCVIDPQPRFTILGLQMHATHGGEQWEILLPPDQTTAVRRIIERLTPAYPGILTEPGRGAVP